MPLTTLGRLISEIGDYDEYRPIWIVDKGTFSKETSCYIHLGDASEYGDLNRFPEIAKEMGMVRFLSSGQMMDIEGYLQYAKEGQEPYTDEELFYCIVGSFKQVHQETLQGDRNAKDDPDR